MPDGSVLQGLLDAAGGSSEVVVPLGVTYTLTTSLLIDANDKLRVDGVIERAWSSSSGTTAAAIRNRSFSNDVDGFHLYGNGTIRAQPGLTGKLIAVKGDNMVFNGIRVGPYSGGQAFYVAGDNMGFRGVRVSGSAAEVGTGGIRIAGGTKVRVVDCYVESGDDAIQVVPGNSASDPLFNLPTTNVVFRRCAGLSSVARFVAVFLDDATTEDLTNVRYHDCVGSGANRAVYIENIGAGTLSDVLIEDCSMALVDQADIQNQEILISNSDDVTLRRVTLSNPTNEWFEINDGCVDVLIEDCTFGAPSAPGDNGGTIWTSTGTIVRRNTFAGGGSVRGIFVKGGAVSASVVDNSISGITSPTPIFDQTGSATISGNA